MEALACGLPVVASRMSGIPELVVEGETGCLAQPGDPSDLAASISRALGSDRPDAALARSRVAAEFATTRTAAQMKALFDDALAARP